MSNPERFSKWTHSSIKKFHEREWSKFLKETLDNETITKEEKNRRIDDWLEWHKMIEHNCVNGLFSVKK